MKLFGITFAAAKNLLFLPVLIFAIVLLIWKYAKTKKVVKFLADSTHFSDLFKHFSSTRLVLKIVLSVLGLSSLFLGLLRPQWDKRQEVVTQEGRDLFIAVDVSRSMLAEDCKPNRLEFAKQKIRTLISMLKTDRVGLVIFSGSAMVQCPLTNDYSAFFMFLDQLDVETISSGTTALDRPIQKVLNVLKQMESKKTKLLVIFTDGEDFSSNLAGVRQEAFAQGLKIFTMGLGTIEGAPVPLISRDGRREGYIKDKRDNIVISRLNEGILSSIAQDTGGVYFRMTESNSALDQLVAMVEKFEKEKFSDKKLPILEEQYHYFVLFSLICFAIEWLL